MVSPRNGQPTLPGGRLKDLPFDFFLLSQMQVLNTRVEEEMKKSKMVSSSEDGEAMETEVT